MQIVEILKSEWRNISNILDLCGKTPDFLGQQIQEIIGSRYSSNINLLNINVAGSPDMPLVYVYNQEHLVICGKDKNLESQPFVLELKNELEVVFQLATLNESENYFGKFLTTKMSKDLEKRLALPSVLLVSLFHTEMYPTPRLTLGIAYIASFLRIQNYAKVSIIDCQFGSTVDDVIEFVKINKPDIIGISVNFGQYDLMEELLNKIYSIFDINQEPIVELGNILASMCFREILDKYPRVVIGKQEGENVLVHLVKNLKDRKKWHNIPGICYKDLETGQILETSSELLALNQLPPPALDTIEDLFNNDGVMTAEFSRGCQYNICSFCPRSHKGNLWRSLPIESMVKQWNFFSRVFNQFGKKPHIFFADEEFIGKDQDTSSVERLDSFLNLVANIKTKINFDIACRADQIYTHSQDKDWHIERGYLFKRLLENGLSRIFVGVESGSKGQLVRYNKGYSPEYVVSALRYFSLLNINLRFGFILFDPLMTPEELCENIDFLGRNDVVLSAQNSLTVEQIFAQVYNAHGEFIDLPSKEAVFENISYMASPLEVLIKSQYLSALKRKDQDLISGEIDTSFARVITSYRSTEIGIICNVCQSWINFAFPIVYTLKGMRKVSDGKTQQLLSNAIKEHRKLSYFLIRTLTQVFQLANNESLNKWEHQHKTPQEIAFIIEDASMFFKKNNIENAIISVQMGYEKLFKNLTKQIESESCLLEVSKKQIWDKVYHNWQSQSIFETKLFRQK